MSKNLPSLASLARIVLRKPNGEEFSARELWENSPAVIVGIRRPGCILCREEAVKLWQAKEEFDKIGARIVCVVHEWKELEVNAFHPTYWPGELYHDFNQDFYKAFGDGNLRRGSLLSFMNPFSRAWANVRRANGSNLVKEHNLNGEGMILGGLLVMKKGEGGPVYMHVESTFGDHADVKDVLEAAKKAVAGSS